MKNSAFSLNLPDWLEEFHTENFKFSSDTDKMNFVIDLAQKNIEYETGGPFAAAVFDMVSSSLVSFGVNLVTYLNCSVFHAEVTAVMLAQKKSGHYDLARLGKFELFTSSQPCAMCTGALLWTGIKRLVFAADYTAAQAIGFDEGPIADDWIAQYNKRDIEVTGQILAEKADGLLKQYKKNNGTIY